MAGEFGTEQRELLEGAAKALYEDTLAAGRLTVDDPRTVDKGAPLRAAFDLLVELGLLSLLPDQSGYVAVDPTAVQSRIVAPMGMQAASLMQESSAWTEVLGNLGQSFRRSSGSRNPVTELRGLTNINRFLDAAFADAATELLCAQPTRGRSTGSLENAENRDTRAVRRGVMMRTLYQHSARRSVAIKQYVEQMAPFGAQVRTLEEFFNRMIIVDRAIAVVPTANPQAAIAIQEPALVQYLADVFERHWERARPFDDHQHPTQRTIAADVRNMTVRMLVEGHSDPASAKRVGVSTRTYAGYIASLKEEYGVQTRFQLGYAMGLQDGQQMEREPEVGAEDGAVPG